MPKFRVEVAGMFYTLELYDAKGREIHNLQDAIAAAIDTYGNDWVSVFNGEVSFAQSDIGDLIIVEVDDDVLREEGYTSIVSQNGDGEVRLLTECGKIEVFVVNDSYSGWCIPTKCGRVLEFYRSEI